MCETNQIHNLPLEWDMNECVVYAEFHTTHKRQLSAAPGEQSFMGSGHWWCVARQNIPTLSNIYPCFTVAR